MLLLMGRVESVEHRISQPSDRDPQFVKLFLSILGLALNMYIGLPLMSKPLLLLMAQ
jgi:hypothetical protein